MKVSSNASHQINLLGNLVLVGHFSKMLAMERVIFFSPINWSYNHHVSLLSWQSDRRFCCCIKIWSFMWSRGKHKRPNGHFSHTSDQFNSKHCMSYISQWRSVALIPFILEWLQIHWSPYLTTTGMLTVNIKFMKLTGRLGTESFVHPVWLLMGNKVYLFITRSLKRMIVSWIKGSACLFQNNVKMLSIPTRMLIFLE